MQKSLRNVTFILYVSLTWWRVWDRGGAGIARDASGVDGAGNLSAALPQLDAHAWVHAAHHQQRDDVEEDQIGRVENLRVVARCVQMAKGVLLVVAQLLAGHARKEEPWRRVHGARQPNQNDY